MALGGMYDHVGGGFARYSVDDAGSCRTSRRCSTTRRCWSRSTSTAWLPDSQAPLYRRVVEQTLDFVRRRVAGRRTGGFHASLDADSEGREEGRVLRLDAGSQVSENVLGDRRRGARFCELYGITSAGGNFEGAEHRPTCCGADWRRSPGSAGWTRKSWCAETDASRELRCWFIDAGAPSAAGDRRQGPDRPGTA